MKVIEKKGWIATVDHSREEKWVDQQEAWAKAHPATSATVAS